MEIRKVAIVAAKRSPIGVYKKTFKDVNMIDFSCNVVNELFSNIDRKEINEVIIGSVLQSGHGQNIARQIGVKSNIPIEVPAYTVNMVCGSSMKAVMLGANSIIIGENDAVLVGGVEFMTDSNNMLKDGLIDSFSNVHMGITAENIAEKFNISRIEMDKYALNSTKKAIKAVSENRFKDEIVPYSEISTDQFIRYNQTIEKLSELKPVFLEGGKVTSGNTTGLNDGAAFMILMEEEKAKSLNLEILGYVKSFANCGLDPQFMGLGPIYSTNKLLKKENLKIEDIDIFELNEAFSAQCIAVQKELKIPDNKLNVNGGALALGHPIGASGIRIIVTLIHEMKKMNYKKGIAALCVGGGQGLSVLIER